MVVYGFNPRTREVGLPELPELQASQVKREEEEERRGGRQSIQNLHLPKVWACVNSCVCVFMCMCMVYMLMYGYRCVNIYIRGQNQNKQNTDKTKNAKKSQHGTKVYPKKMPLSLFCVRQHKTWAWGLPSVVVDMSRDNALENTNFCLTSGHQCR